MNPESKQRIVGVVVLVAFIALLVPFLFTSGIKNGHQSSSSNEPVPIQVADVNSTSERQPVASSQGVSENVVGQQQVLPDSMQQQSVPSVQSEIQPKEQVESQSILSNSDQDLSSGVVPSQNVVPFTPPVVADVNVEQSTIPTTVAKVDPEPAIVEPVKPEPVFTVKDQKSTLKNTPAVVNKAKKAAKGKGAAIFWSVQVGSFSDQPRMQKIVSSLQANGFHVYLQKINTSRGQMVRVLVGREVNKAKAIKISQQLKTKLKIDGRIVRNKK